MASSALISRRGYQGVSLGVRLDYLPDEVGGARLVDAEEEDRVGILIYRCEGRS